MMIVAPPLVNVVAPEVKPPPVSVTVPVGVGLPTPPLLTTTVTVKACAVVMLVLGEVTITGGVVFAGLVTAMGAEPVALL
jgi:hypothetical protein